MNWKLTSLVVAVLASPALLPGQTVDPAQVLADMRGALGGAMLADVTTLTAEGVIQRVTPRGTVERTVELAVALPDKYVTRTQLTDQGNMSVYRRAGFNGDGLINATDAPPNLAAAGRDRLSSDRPLTPPTEEQQAAAALRTMMVVKKDFARFGLAQLGMSSEAFPLELSYAGLAESPDGSAHVIAAKGADDFEVRLFVDATTHMPLMMTWNETRPARPAAGQPDPTVVELRLYYSSFKTVDGVMFPHTWRRAVDGNVTEETTWNTVAINPAIDSKMFDVSR